jgi:spermidine synthase
MFLMSSDCRGSERALGRLAAGRSLIGGLGMGFTLRAALDQPGALAIDVVEISQAVVDWNRGPLAHLAERPLEDARVRVHVMELAAFLRSAPRAAYDAILLDVDNGPSWTARPENSAIYDDAGLELLARLLAPSPSAVVAIWSASEEPELSARLARRFASVETRAIAVTVGDRASHDYLILGREPLLRIG